MPLKTIKQILENSPISRPEIYWLISLATKKPEVFVIAHPEYQLKTSELNLVNKIIKQRLKNIPLAYITGHKEFYSRDFIVNRHTLVPRPESEIMVGLVIKEAQTKKSGTIIDIGCGSGCLIISAYKELKNNKFKYYGLDISSQALLVARKNGTKTKIEFLKSDLLSNKKIVWPKENLIIMANLPYLTPQQFKEEPSIKAEPRTALVSGRDGLWHYKKLLKQLPKIKNISLYMEINPEQETALKEILAKYPTKDIKAIPDLSGRTRFIMISI